MPDQSPSARADARAAYCVQLAATALVVTLLNIGMYWQRTLKDMDLRNNLKRLIEGWDGREWYLWALAAPVMMWLIRVTPLSLGAWRSSLTRLIAGNLLLYALLTNLRYGIRVLSLRHVHMAGAPPLTARTYWHTQSMLLPIDFLTYGAFFSAAFAIDSYLKYRRRSDEMRDLELRTAQLETELNRAQLSALRGHLQPHFLFNAFNAIATLVRKGDAGRAIEMIARLGDLLRVAIEHVDTPELPLSHEFEFASRYLDLEQLRFSDKLRTEVALDPVAAGALVPNFLLQPLLENAVRHGICRRVTPGVISLRAQCQDGRVQVQLRGDGADGNELTDTSHLLWSPAEVAFARSRLDNLYGSDYRFEVTRAAGATHLDLELPWRTRR